LWIIAEITITFNLGGSKSLNFTRASPSQKLTNSVCTQRLPNYSKCCSSPMAEATSIEFSHIIQQYLTFMMTKRQQRYLFSTKKLYSDIQSSTFPPELHDEPKPLVRIANGLGRSSQQKQTTQDFFILAVKLDSVLTCLCDKKLNFLSWAIRPVFAEPVTIIIILWCKFCKNKNGIKINVSMN